MSDLFDFKGNIEDALFVKDNEFDKLDFDNLSADSLDEIKNLAVAHVMRAKRYMKVMATNGYTFTIRPNDEGLFDIVATKPCITAM